MKQYFEQIDRDALRTKANQMLGYADNAREAVTRWTDYGLDRAHGFSVLDFAIFKTCVFSFGLWLGTCLAKPLKKLRGLIFVLFAASWLYLLWRVFFDDED